MSRTKWVCTSVLGSSIQRIQRVKSVISRASILHPNAHRQTTPQLAPTSKPSSSSFNILHIMSNPTTTNDGYQPTVPGGPSPPSSLPAALPSEPASHSDGTLNIHVSVTPFKLDIAQTLDLIRSPDAGALVFFAGKMIPMYMILHLTKHLSNRNDKADL